MFEIQSPEDLEAYGFSDSYEISLWSEISPMYIMFIGLWVRGIASHNTDLHDIDGIGFGELIGEVIGS